MKFFNMLTDFSSAQQDEGLPETLSILCEFYPSRSSKIIVQVTWMLHEVNKVKYTDAPVLLLCSPNVMFEMRHLKPVPFSGGADFYTVQTHKLHYF